MLQIVENTLTNNAENQAITLENGEATIESSEVNFISGEAPAPLNLFGGFLIEALNASPTASDISNRSARILNVNGQVALYVNWDGVIVRLSIFGTIS